MFVVFLLFMSVLFISYFIHDVFHIHDVFFFPCPVRPCFIEVILRAYSSCNIAYIFWFIIIAYILPVFCDVSIIVTLNFQIRLEKLTSTLWEARALATIWGPNFGFPPQASRYHVLWYTNGVRGRPYVGPPWCRIFVIQFFGLHLFIYFISVYLFAGVK